MKNRRVAVLAALLGAMLVPGTAVAADPDPAPAADRPAAAVAVDRTVKLRDVRLTGKTRGISAEAAYGRIRNVGSHKCLAVPGGSQVAGTGLIQWTCGDWPDHFWTLEYTNVTGLFRVRNYGTNQCLAVPNASTADGVQVIQWPCGTYPDHFWWFIDYGGEFHIENYNSAKCLAVQGGSHADGARAIQWPCGNYHDHYWY